MTTALTPTRAAGSSGLRAAAVVALVGSAGAGLVHGAAVRNHEGDQLLVVMFALCALAQLGWVAVAARRPSRAVLLVGLVVNAGALLVWGLTRTVGIAFVGPLAEVEAVGTPDLAGALFAAASVLGAAWLLLRPVGRLVLSPGWVASVTAVALVAALPALTAGHDHDHGGTLHLASGDHAHGDGDAAADGHDDAGDHASGHADGSAHADGAMHDDAAHDDAAHDDAAGHDDSVDHAAGHDEGAGADLVAHDHGGGALPPSDTGHDHPTTDPAPHHPPTDDPHDHPTEPTPTGPIISLDDPRVTPAQRAIAAELIADTEAGMANLMTVAQVKAAGYTSIGDGGANGYEHFVKWEYLYDAFELDPDRIESIVVKKSAGVSTTVVSGMYILSLGQTMADVPALAGPLTTWHDHQNLCFNGTKLVGLAVDGVCQTGVLLPTPPMLHVWVVENPCGPFAGVDEHGPTDCAAHDH